MQHLHSLMCVLVFLTSLSLPRPAFWDATRAFMLLAVLSCFSGVVLGLSAFTNGSKNRRIRTGGIALVLSGNSENPGKSWRSERERECVSLGIWCSGVFLSNISHQCSHLISGFLALLALAIYTGVTVTFFGKRFTSWRFSWSYIIGWVAIILAFTAGLFRVLFVWTSQPVINKDKDDDSFIVISSPVT